MDYGVFGLLAAIAIVLGAFYVGRPRAPVSLDELLTTLTRIAGDTDLTAVQKEHQSQVVYRAFENRTVSLVGAVEDVFPSGAIVMRTSSRDLPTLGFELKDARGDDLRTITKGRSVTLRAKLPPWKRFTEAADLAAGLSDGKVFCAGRWYGVKSTYRVRSNSVAPAKAGAQGL